MMQGYPFELTTPWKKTLTAHQFDWHVEHHMFTDEQSFKQTKWPWGRTCCPSYQELQHNYRAMQQSLDCTDQQDRLGKPGAGSNTWRNWQFLLMGEELDFYQRATRKFMYEKNEVELPHCITYTKTPERQDRCKSVHKLIKYAWERIKEAIFMALR